MRTTIRIIFIEVSVPEKISENNGGENKQRKNEEIGRKKGREGEREGRKERRREGGKKALHE